MDKPFYLPTYQDDLAAFVGELRDLLFSSQEEAAAYFHLNRSRISRYEDTSAKDKPRVGYLACLAQLAIERTENELEARQLVLQEINKIMVSRHYRKSRFRDWEALCHTADTYLSQQRTKPATKSSPVSSPASQTKDKWQAKLEKRLDLPLPVQLIGVEDYLSRLSDLLASSEAPGIVCIDGLGGLGKTSLANALIRQSWIPDQFQNVAWVSAKQQNLLPDIGLEQLTGPALNADALTDALLEQLDSTIPLAQPPHQKKAALAELLKKAAYLIVIDNLESAVDYESLLPILLKLAQPTRFLLTSRHSLRTHPNVFSFNLKELSQVDTLHLLRHELHTRGLSTEIDASEDQLNNIHKVVGGNPLALKLVVGQMSVLSLPEIIENLERAQSKSIDELYTFIYWQAWHALDEISQHVFLLMPLAHDGTLNQLIHLTQYEKNEVNQALQQLAKLSLIQIGGNLEERRYFLHRLTETFILTEAIVWRKSV